jgi:HSP20 family molecular chaperone IbpA
MNSKRIKLSESKSRISGDVNVKSEKNKKNWSRSEESNGRFEKRNCE